MLWLRCCRAQAMRIAGRRLLRLPTRRTAHPSHGDKGGRAVVDACKPHGRRLSSSRRRGGYRKSWQLDALPFSVTVDEALKRFDRWSRDEGIVSLLSLGSTKITPSRSSSPSVRPSILHWTVFFLTSLLSRWLRNSSIHPLLLLPSERKVPGQEDEYTSHAGAV